MVRQTRRPDQLRQEFVLLVGYGCDVMVAGFALIIECYERTAPGAGEISRAVDDFLEDGLAIEPFGDADAGVAQSVNAFPQGLVFFPESSRLDDCSISLQKTHDHPR